MATRESSVVPRLLSRLGGLVSLALLALAACGIDSSPTAPFESQVGQSSIRLLARSPNGWTDVARGSVILPRTSGASGASQPVVRLDSSSVGAQSASLRARPGGLLPRLEALQASLGSSANLQPRIEGRRIEIETVDGKASQLILSGGKERGKNRENLAASFYVDDRLVGVQELTLGIGQGRRTLIAGRLTLFDSTGRATLALEMGPEGPVHTASKTRIAPRDALNRLASMLTPSPLHAAAASVESEIPCGNQLAAVLGLALADVAVGASALATAVSACMVTGAACGAVVGAVALVTGMSVALYAAVVSLRECMEQEGYAWYGGNGSTGGTTSGGGSDDGCITIHWWISYDEGVTWSFWFTEIRCGPINAQ